jgi:hypothetical protein
LPTMEISRMLARNDSKIRFFSAGVSARSANRRHASR